LLDDGWALAHRARVDVVAEDTNKKDIRGRRELPAGHGAVEGGARSAGVGVRYNDGPVGARAHHGFVAHARHQILAGEDRIEHDFGANAKLKKSPAYYE
jgi:hypothetical protein